MLGNMSRWVCALTAAGLVAATSVASAQWYPAANPCSCAQPVTQTCYQTVPVTEYREVRQTVRRPVIETQYVERPVTEYRPVVETRTATVPTVQYQEVTECQTQYRDRGQWITRYQPIPRMSPCEYDDRPGIVGAVNRAGYSIRTAFTPPYRTTREYHPNVVAQAVPVTRRVAIQGSRQVTYNVTRYVPQTTTRKMAVNTVRYVDEEVVAMQPVTVMKTLPIGTRTAYAYTPYYPSTSQLAIQPSPDPVSAARASEPPKRTADSQTGEAPAPEKTQPNATGADNGGGVPATRSSMRIPLRQSTSEDAYPRTRVLYRSQHGPAPIHQAPYAHPESTEPAPARQPASVHPAPAVVAAPSAVIASRWRVRVPAVTGPTLTQPAVSIADNDR